MGSEARQLHLFFFPLMAHGHTIPIIDIARLFAARGNKSTIITTPLNAPHFSETIDQERQSGLDIGVEIIQFPSIEAGLPQGCESIDSIPSPEMITNFFTALSLPQQPFEQLLQRCQPDCVVADMFLTWTTKIASKHGIPRLVFHGTSHFTHCLTENIKCYAPHEKVAFDSEFFVVPGLPDQIEMTKFELPDLPKLYNNLTDLIAKVEETELTSFGVLVNSFYELEPA
ncbi:hypothetical protein IFM89_005813 [Coptis chinensis]|uniref:Uncharacterized protein n=1 Tax=Coptis chinensis TaxID=261450 RepID=A0A835IL86_9MAGN|nr:hypothetical protein IFM89_005813 [Coptis chinensis]